MGRKGTARHSAAPRAWLRGLLTPLLALTTLLSGCGINLVPGLGEPADVYDLTPRSTYPEELPHVSWQLVVEEPFGSRAVDTDRIVVRPTEYQLGYFKAARWSDRAPRLVQTLLVESFENTGRIVGVGRQAIGLRANYDLKTELREFHAEYGEDGMPRAYVRLTLKIVRQPSALIIGSATFEHKSPAPSSDMGGIVTAFDDALGLVLKRSVIWTVETIEAYEAEHGRTGLGTKGDARLRPGDKSEPAM